MRRGAAAMTSDFGEHMKAVALALLGEPNRHLSKGADLRFGSNGSMSVNLKKGRFYSLEAKKGCGVLDLIKLVKGLDAPAAINWMRSKGLPSRDRRHSSVNGAHYSCEVTKKVEPKKEIEAIYEYTDEEGRLLFQSVRYVFKKSDGTLVMTREGKPAKTFLQRRRDPKTGDWVWNVKGCRLVPYKLPELVEAIANQRMIFVVEGENCGHSASRRPATPRAPANSRPSLCNIFAALRS
jgi:hypothetical protein